MVQQSPAAAFFEVCQILTDRGLMQSTNNGSSIVLPFESQRGPLWVTSPMTSAITRSNRKAIVLMFVGNVWNVLCKVTWQVSRPSAIVTSSSKGSLFDASKIKNAPIEMKIGTGLFSTTPDTMAVSVLRENDVITLPRPFYSLATWKIKVLKRWWKFARL